MKQEVRAQLTAMSRDHVMDEDIQMFARVQEVALQVRSRRREVDVTRCGHYLTAACTEEPVYIGCLSRKPRR